MKSYLPRINGFFKWRQKLSLLIVFPFLLFNFSCIEQFTPELDDFNPSNLLVVEGQITDKIGSFRVKLSSTFEIDNNQLYGPPVYGADVQIFDDKGNQFQLYSKAEGWYETENKQLKGVVGSTYTLNITLEDGTQYESSPVLMLDVPEIESVYYQEVDRFHFNKFGYNVDQEWLDIVVDSKDPTGQTKYWKWDFVETWEVRMPKDSARLQIVNDGFIVANLEFLKGNTKYGWDNEKEKCWVTVPSTSILIESTNNQTVDEIVSFPVTSIPPDGDKLHVKYSILVEQTALNKNIYDYLRRLEEINETSVSMYNKVPSQIFGNIDCCDSNGKALGYFSASAINSKRIFINPLDHDVTTQGAYSKCGYDGPLPMLYYYATVVASLRNPGYVGGELWTTEWCADCRLYAREIAGGRSESRKPDFWED